MPTTTRQWLLNGHPRGRGIELENDFKSSPQPSCPIRPRARCC